MGKSINNPSSTPREKCDEYKIDVGLTPHTWDNPKEPYYWCIFGHYASQDAWCNEGFGWAKSPEEAFNQAMSYHKNYHLIIINAGLAQLARVFV